MARLGQRRRRAQRRNPVRLVSDPNYLLARVREEDSETPYMTGRAIEFMAGRATIPSCYTCPTSPHWLISCPRPIAICTATTRFAAGTAGRGARQRASYQAYMKHPESLNFPWTTCATM